MLISQDKNSEIFAALVPSGQFTVAEYKDMVTKSEELLLTLPQVEPECVQHFLPGLYSRQITIPTGMVLTGGVHKTDSIIIVSKGELIVATENGPVTITAPATFIGHKGVKRVAYCTAECVWTNIHKYDGPPMDNDAMKDFIVCDTYEDYEIHLMQEDYKLFLSEIGKTDLEVVAMVVDTDDVVALDEPTYVEIAPSKVSCNGIFAIKDFCKGEYIGKGSHGENRTILTRFTNHSHNPNVSVSLEDGNCIFTANKDISTGEELTVNYRDVIFLRSTL